LGSLFNSTFLRRLETLRLVARKVPRGGRIAEQTSAGHGGGIEFADYRDYAPGESLKRVDWNIYQRLGKLFLRLFVEDLDLPVNIVMDLSDSVFLNRKRAEAGMMVAGALAWIGAAGHDRVKVHPFGSNVLPPYGPVTSKASCMGLLDWLEGQEGSGGTGMIEILRRIRGIEGRRGLLVLVSDFFCTEGLDGVLAELSRQNHRVLLIQLFDPEDGEPALRGEVQVKDCETGELRDVTITPDVLKRYRDAHSAFEEKLHDFARRRQAGLLKIDVTGDVILELEQIFKGGRLKV
jgi:uncharacterized protein (DUF58 family)